jgi:hypothetical protein
MSKKAKQRKKATTPVFSELAELEEDEWWKKLFYDMADGYFLNKTGYVNGNLYFKNTKGKLQILQIQGIDDLDTLGEQMKVFFLKNVGIIPDSYFSTSSVVSKDYEILKWANFKKPSIYRSILILNYLETLELTEEETNLTYTNILLGLLNKTMNENDFGFSQNIIEYIELPREQTATYRTTNFSEHREPVIFILKKKAKRVIQNSLTD